MASIRRTDIMHKSFSKGRPAKTERERNKRRQEAYKWRDARRIYLANSFDKWRKLRSSLGMKDSGLAWHLMEAHEKGQCGICKRSKETCKQKEDSLSLLKTNEFLPSLISAIRTLCESHFQYENCLKIVGLLCLEFDNVRKENFSLNETLSAKSTENLECGDQTTPSTEVLSKLSLSSHIDVPAPCPNATQARLMEVHSKTSLDADLKEDTAMRQTCTPNSLESPDGKLNTSHAEMPVINELPEQISHQDGDNSINTIGIKINDKEVPQEIEKTSSTKVTDCSSDSKNDLPHQNQNAVGKDGICDEPSLSVDNAHPNTSNIAFEIKSMAVLKHEPDENVAFKDQICSYNNSCVELPLDMSLIKSECLKNEMDKTLPKTQQGPSPSDYNKQQLDLIVHQKSKATDANESQQASHSGLPSGVNDISNKGRRHKDEFNPSIPWQRRDMSRKEEYEFLEMNPFSDLAEFSLRYPHVHQRTYYRWKRRIKEEYIILEQCPDMTFEQFSSVVLQAKEVVFNLWKGFISQGKGFFAPSADASSKRIENKLSPAKLINNFSAEYVYLQKNLSSTQEQFCRKYPGISADVFYVLKKKVMQEFWLFCQNKHMKWNEFSKILNVTEDVYNSWRDYAELMQSSSTSSDVKSGLGVDSPSNTSILSSSFSQFLDSPPLPVESNSHSSKDNLQSSAVNHFNSQTLPLDSTLKDSVSRSLSASYLNSLQNMILPWSSYYNMPSLGQQMLPMMLWPRMLGLTSGLVGPMNINSLVPASSSSLSGSTVNPPTDAQANSSRGVFVPHTVNEDKKIDDGFHSLKTDGRSIKNHAGKRASDCNRESDSYENEGMKKQKLREELDGGSSSYSRSRKQNKQEYIYYLKNPELCFKDLETLFPTISVRTFYRWRKEMNAALLFIGDNKELNYQQFKLVFPDIPEDIFDSWKSKPGKLFTPKSDTKDTDAATGDETFSDKFIYKNGRSSISEYSDVADFFGRRSKIEHYDRVSVTDYSSPIGGESCRSQDILREAHLYLHKNPTVEFTVFSQMFPDVSASTYFTWKREWKTATDFLRAKPEFSYEKYKAIDGFVSKEIFDAWKASVFPKETNSSDNCAPGESKKVHGHCNRKNNGPEFIYLQLNPNIDFSHFTQIHPDVPSRTFYRWKREIQQILSYVRAQPTVTFTELSSVLPDLCEEAFFKWKEIIQHDGKVSDMKDKADISVESTGQVNEEAKTKMTKALLHLMHNPTMGFNDFKQIHDFISLETFQLWIHRIKLVVLHISSNPDLDYAEFSSAITDIGEDVFKKWKSLTSEEISSIGQDCQEMPGISENSKNINDVRDALVFCQRYPDVTYETFSSKYPNVLKSQFKQWIMKISDQINFISDNQGLTFEDFHKVFDDVDESVFESWKEKSFHLYIDQIKEENEDAIPNFLQKEIDVSCLTQTKMENDESSAVSDSNLDSSTSQENSHLNDSGKNGSSAGPYSTEREVRTSQANECNEHLQTTSGSQESSITLCMKGSGKENANVSAESSLSKLTKFAESDVSMYTGWSSDNQPEETLSDCTSKTTEEQSDFLFHKGEKGSCFKTLHKSHRENDLDNNNVNFTSLYNSNLLRSTNNSCNKLMSTLSTDLDAKTVFSSSTELNNPLSKYEKASEGLTNCLTENKSLSALMVMSTNKSRSFTSPSFKHENGAVKSHSSCTSSRNVSQTGVKEDDEIFSSQRQKKMSRAEYLFVKDNPDVDSQEFARIFPGVSARTFYRWKKEIKAQIQIP